jgi:hypothetical protein
LECDENLAKDSDKARAAATIELSHAPRRVLVFQASQGLGPGVVDLRLRQRGASGGGFRIWWIA